MKKIISMALLAAAVLSLTACGSGSTESTSAADSAAESTAAKENSADASETTVAETTEADVKTVTDGVLTVAISPDFAPYEFYSIGENEEPELAGFEISMAQRIADEMGLELDLVPMSFDGVLAEIANGTVDIGIAGLGYTEDRAEVMDFSDPYNYVKQTFVCRKEDQDKFKDVDSVNNSDVLVAVQTGSTQQEVAANTIPDADILLLNKATDMVAELIDGKVDGALMNDNAAGIFVINYPDLVISFNIPYEKMDNSGDRIAIPKGHDDMKAAVNAVIAKVMEDGSMDEYKKEAYKLAAGDIYEGLLEN